MKKKNYSEILTTVLCTVFSTSKIEVKFDCSRGYSLWYDGSLVFYDLRMKSCANDLSDYTVFFIQRVQRLASSNLLDGLDYLPF
ncbi:MAG: hypothetical protein IKI72_05275 [Bacteroidales bacterium]|nr:hypothetical protein [Bacteroidales bacterium]